MSRKLTAALAAVAIAVASVIAVPTAAFAEEGECPAPKKQVAAGKLKEDALWAQNLLDVKRVWSTTRGKDVTVAVIDSGVAADHELLSDRVESGGKAWVKSEKNEPAKGGDNATEDCDGHGTEIAGIIAATEDEDSGFYGLAPEAKIIPYRIANARPAETEQQSTKDKEDKEQDDPPVTESDFAAAITDAAKKADVINLSVKYAADHDVIREAVKNAIDDGKVVVAAAGNNGKDPKPSDTYPANYPGVIGVGAVDRNISKVETSQSGPWVDVVAPGSADLAAPLPNGKYEPTFGGTSGATAFVSGTAALLKAQHPDWDGKQISDQILATASPTPGGSGMAGDKNLEGREGVSPDYGYGLVDPYMAVTAKMGSGAAQDTSKMDAPEADKAAMERNADMANMRAWALWIGLGSLALFVAALASVGALRRGKKTGWHVKKIDRKEHIEHFDDGDPIPMFHGIKGLKELSNRPEASGIAVSPRAVTEGFQ